MVFSSLIFTFYFLPAILILYYLAKDKYRNLILLVFSLCFYAYGEPKFIFVMMFSIIMNYVLALMIDQHRGKAKPLLILDVVLNVGILFFYKYLNFGISITNSLFGTKLNPLSITLPIGISFFTFQALSYVIDVYRGTSKAQKNPLYPALYISFFPQLIAGPIVRYHDIEEQMTCRSSDIYYFGEGIKRFFIGFCKKIILANNMSIVAEEIFAMKFTTVNPLVLWLGSVCYCLHSYYDFSGYSDMAIGLGKMFGFTFPENFNYPYICSSMTDFWRRWHISLGQWFRDYVFIPLGGSRRSLPRNVFNMFVIWFLTGVWHGANFTYIFWGLSFFVMALIEKYIVKPDQIKSRVYRIIWRVVTLLFLNFVTVIFFSPTLTAGLRYCLSMLGVYVHDFSIDANIIFYLREYGIYLIFAIIFAAPVMKYFGKISENTIVSKIHEVMEPVILGALFLWAVSFLILGVHNPFLYFNF